MAEKVEYFLKSLDKEDFERGFIECLSELTVWVECSKEKLLSHFAFINASPDYKVIVAYDPTENRVIGSGTLFIEHKFIRGCATKGHIEDVVVIRERRGKGIGQEIVKTLLQMSGNLGCYKTSLVCDESKVGFYERCGLLAKEREMVKYHIPESLRRKE
jgi:glucosamine-phosphate N-acetyltransferase